VANFNWAYINVDGVTAVNALSASTYVSASTFHGDGSGLTGITPAAAGSDGQIQYNESNALTASSNLVWANNDSILSVTGQISASLGLTASAGFLNVLEVASGTTVIDGTQISSSLNMSASAFYGDGSNLSGISGGSSTSYNSFTANFSVSASYDVMGINSSGSIVTASLGAANVYTAGQRLVFKDIEGSGSTNNIVIEPSGSQTIDGGTSVKIQTNYGSVILTTDGSSAFYIIGTN